jgi:hypothetical protein
MLNPPGLIPSAPVQPPRNPPAFLSAGDSATFEEVCRNPSVTVHPRQLGFIPSSAWPDVALPFGVLVVTFFQKRNSRHCKFPYKIFNALRLTEMRPELFRFVGIRWVTSEIIVVEKFVFAKLLGVRSVDGSLFHQQGNFPSHGFVELSFQEAQEVAAANGEGEVDSHTMRFLRPRSAAFVRDRGEDVIHELGWIPP